MGWKEDFLYKMFVEKDTKNGLQLYVENQPETIFRYRQGNENDINALKNNQNAFDIEKYVKHLYHAKIRNNDTIDEVEDVGEISA